MNTQLYQQTKTTRDSTFTKVNATILSAIIALANTYSTAKSYPSKYSKYGYDFPAMIKKKVIKLCELNPNDPWILTLSDSLLKALDSPDEIIAMCTPIIRRKEYANVYR